MKFQLMKEDEEIVDEEQFSDHRSNSEEELDSSDGSSNESSTSVSANCYFGKDKVTKWNKKEPRLDVRTRAHNIVTKLPGNVGEAKWEIDKLAPIRNVFKKFVENCKNVYSLGEYVTIDEKLEPFRGRCSFRQYILSKPAKYGIKVFALVDARTFYTSNLEIYAARQPTGPYSLDNGPPKVVQRLVEPILNSGRNLTVDKRKLRS
ncbi:uncharacterized protein LOC118188202 [Stegodyphus dumicola]|uniref:uncharacterized protein LOC118188202 n=1 Tax=Stegodyphus dumicola TaxID=202533 RepID=UPI0015B18C91|nr:uncharacterized protein LOC118188202 [Stegodyphus dumicola]